MQINFAIFFKFYIPALKNIVVPSENAETSAYPDAGIANDVPLKLLYDPVLGRVTVIVEDPEL